MHDESTIERLEHALAELRIINRIIDRICRVRETNHIMSVIIDELVAFTSADQGVINLLSREKDTSYVTVVRHSHEASDEMPFKLSSLLSGWVLKNKTMLQVNDLDSDERFPGLTSEDGLFKSVLCCPMSVRGEMIGLTSLVRGESKGQFTETQARVSGVVASQSAQVLSAALLLEELARKTELLEVSQQKLRSENAQLKAEIDSAFSFENIIGTSPAMREVMKMTSKVSATDSPVLITGPTGTGKELIARVIHQHSQRNEAPFVVKNCGVKTETLLESELFGHIKGSFTGADRDKPGLFKEADGGTVFLDEIGDAPLSTQVAILRVLETGEIRPVGATRPEYVNIRIISATNQDLRKLMDDGRFRNDLFYRLNTFTVDLPPLHQRDKDIPLLVHHFLKKLRIKLGNDNLSVSSAAMDLICRYSWPGNVRQLEHEIERAAVVCDSEGIIEPGDLSLELRSAGDPGAAVGAYPGKLRDIVQNVEIDLIRSKLSEHRGNILRTSEDLGLTRKGLRDKMTRYGITFEDEP